MMQYGVALFNTDPVVIWAWRLLTDFKYSIRIIPTPKEFSGDDCGIALRFDWNEREQLKLVLNNARVDFEAIYFLETHQELNSF